MPDNDKKRRKLFKGKGKLVSEIEEGNLFAVVNETSIKVSPGDFCDLARVPGGGIEINPSIEWGGLTPEKRLIVKRYFKQDATSFETILTAKLSPKLRFFLNFLWNTIVPRKEETKSKRIRDGAITSFFQKKSQKLNEEGSSNPSQRTSGLSSSSPVNNSDQETQNDQGGNFNSTTQPSVVRLTEFDILSFPQDPGLRKRIVDYHPNDREIVQREYIRRGPCQPRNHDFPQTSSRRFKAEWFKNHESWLEYSEEKDDAYCFACYLFKKENAVGGDAFVNNGFRTWSRTSAFDTHEGNHMSAHNKATRDLDNFKKQKSSIVSRLENHSAATKSAYLTRLEASVKTVRFLLLQGLSFRGHDEKVSSLNRGNFIALLKLLGEHDEKIAKVVLDKAPKNCILTCSDIQKEIANACATVTTSKIIQELDGDFFSILVDESGDIADKEQMALCLRYVDKKGQLKERFFSIVHVGDTTSLTLKKAIAEVFKKFSLTFSRLRGQGYDGASNMQGSLNGLKTLILNESPSTTTTNKELTMSRKELDIVNAIRLVDATKKSLQHMRDNGWDCHMKKVSEFCSKHNIEVPCMDASYVIPGRHRRGRREVKNLHHFQAEDLLFFECQLDTFKYDVQSDDRFWNLKSLNERSMKLVETKKHLTHFKVYLLLKLVLVLPVATATVERAFSAMTFIKNKLRNSMGDEWLNDILVTFVERDVFLKVTVDEIVHEFMNMRTRRIV
ncbi:uncharacterized protein LOC141655580 [Silene latifolia]|uniref:uncharacterized protein LOC141655580 n=1 Tax=Silene latifolia TaxID=37657 RepID=UPI003D76BB58